MRAMTPLPKIAKPRPVKWGKPRVVEIYDSGERWWQVQVYSNYLGGQFGPLRKTKAAAILAWNKQEQRK